MGCLGGSLTIIKNATELSLEFNTYIPPQVEVFSKIQLLLYEICLVILSLQSAE